MAESFHWGGGLPRFSVVKRLTLLIGAEKTTRETVAPDSDVKRNFYNF